MLKLCNKYSPLVFLKKLEKVKITGECFVNLKIIDDAFALANMTLFCLIKNALRKDKQRANAALTLLLQMSS